MSFDFAGLGIALISLTTIGMICGHIARKFRNRDYKVWFLLGFLFGLIALIILLFLPAKKDLAVATQPASKDGQIPEITGASKAESSNNSQALPMITNLWYYLDSDETQVGPLTFQRLKDAMIDNKLSESTYIWNEDLDEWKKLEELPEYLEILKD